MPKAFIKRHLNVGPLREVSAAIAEDKFTVGFSVTFSTKGDQILGCVITKSHKGLCCQPDLNFDSGKPVSDYMEITPGGNIVLLFDSDTMGLPSRPTAILAGTEPGGLGSVVFKVDGTTYTVFSDVAPVPEPSTILLFDSGLLAFFARRKRH